MKLTPGQYVKVVSSFHPLKQGEVYQVDATFKDLVHLVGVPQKAFPSNIFNVVHNLVVGDLVKVIYGQYKGSVFDVTDVINDYIFLVNTPEGDHAFRAEDEGVHFVKRLDLKKGNQNIQTQNRQHSLTVNESSKKEYTSQFDTTEPKFDPTPYEEYDEKYGLY